MGEPWSIVAEHPATGEPYGIVMQDDSTFAEAEDIARSLLATCRLLGTFLPTDAPNAPVGHYLFTYRVHPDSRLYIGTIWAACQKDAILRLNILAEEGVLFMPSSG